MATDTLSLVFSALADPTRRAILAQLAEGARPVGEIAKPFQISAPAVTKHLKVLERAGLIRSDRKAQRRPRSLEAEPLRDAQEWLERYRRFWEESFDRLDAYLQEVQMDGATTTAILLEASADKQAKQSDEVADANDRQGSDGANDRTGKDAKP